MAVPLPGRVEITFFRVGGSVNCCDSVNTKEKARVQPPLDPLADARFPTLNLENVPSNYVLCFKKGDWLVRPPEFTDDWPTSHNKKVQQDTLQAALDHFQRQLSSEHWIELSCQLPKKGWLTVEQYCKITQWVAGKKTSPDEGGLLAFPPAQYVLKYNSHRRSLDATPLSLGDKLTGSAKEKQEAWDVVKRHFACLPDHVKAAMSQVMHREEGEWLTVGKYREIFQAATGGPQGSPDRIGELSTASFPRGSSPDLHPPRVASSPIEDDDLPEGGGRRGSE